MRISQWKLYFNLTRVLFAMLIFVSIFPASFFEMLILNDCSQDETAINELQGAGESFIDVTRFMNETENAFTSQTESSQNSRSPPNFAIGSQTGMGGGIYNIFDSLNVVNTTSLTTQNNITTGELPPTGEGTGTPSEHNASFTIGAVTDFTREDLQFEIQSVISASDWREIENETAGVDPRPSSPTYIEAAQEINITDDYANITHVHIYLRYYDAAFGSGGIPTGNVSIFDDSGSGGEPGIQLSTTTLEDGFTTSDVGLDMTAWITYEFPNPINVTKGKYWLVLNDTSANAANYWVWYTQKDSNGEDYGEWLARSTHGGTWSKEPFPAGDIVSAIKILPTDVNMNELTCTSPEDISMTYNTTDGNYTLTSFTFKANSTSQHVFYTNTSVDFVLESIANYSYTLNPINGKVSYKVQNNTVSNWNITFSITKVSNPNGFVRNRTIRIIGIQSDWNGTKIYWNDSSTPEYLGPLDANVNVTYVNGSSTMVVNASTLAENTTWHIWFDAPNYISSFNWQFSNNNVTTATTMDVLEANYTFVTPNIGGRNFSIWIEAADGTLVNSSIDNAFGTNDLYNWDVNQSIHNAFLTDKANGTYQTYAFWENTTNNQVGFYSRNTTIFIHTTLFVEAPNEVLEDTWLNMTIHYNATHIETGVNNGNVTGLFGWNKTSETFNQPLAFGLYNLSIWIDENDHVPGEETNVTIFAEMPWYQNHTEIWNITVVSDTTFSVIDVPTNLILEYGQTHLLKVNYLYMGAFLDEANMTVDGDNENYTKETDHYSYLLNTRNYNSGESYFNLEIQLNRSGYLTQKLYFNLTVTAGSTSVHQAYTPIIPSIYYTENYSFSVLYNNTVDNKGIINAEYNTTYSSAIDFWYFNSSGYYFFNLSSAYVSLGFHTINVTLNHSNYQENFILLTFNIVEMPTEPLDSYSISSNQIMVEETITVSIENFQTYEFKAISAIDDALILLNDSSVDSSHVSFVANAPFSIVLDTTGIQYGNYNMTVILSTYGYASQAISFNVSIDGYKTEISVEIEPGKNIQQGEDIIFIATLAYDISASGGAGAGVTQQIGLGEVNITFYVVLEYENGTTRIYEVVKQTDNSNYQATYTIEGIYTKDAIKFTNITIYSAPGLSGLPYTYSMPANVLETYKILPPAIDIFEVITAVLIAVVVFLVGAFITVSTVRIFRRRRRVRKQLILRHDVAVEQSFEDIKSIRLIIARHESGLQFYSEKTIAELTTDTDALSGMSAALSSFMEEVSETMVSRPEDVRKEKIEVMSREGLHMLVWHGFYSSLIIISEVRLPDYFRDRLEGLGKELEAKFVEDLQDFYSTDQIPSSVVKKMVRKYIPLHYFSAFVLNEGVLTLDSIKLSKKDINMLKLIKQVLFKKRGVEYFFSEQIISHLTRHYKRSEAIEFLDRAIYWNLLVECSQDDLIQLGQ